MPNDSTKKVAEPKLFMWMDKYITSPNLEFLKIVVDRFQLNFWISVHVFPKYLVIENLIIEQIKKDYPVQECENFDQALDLMRPYCVRIVCRVRNLPMLRLDGILHKYYADTSSLRYENITCHRDYEEETFNELFDNPNIKIIGVIDA